MVFVVFELLISVSEASQYHTHRRADEGRPHRIKPRFSRLSHSSGDHRRMKRGVSHGLTRSETQARANIL